MKRIVIAATAALLMSAAPAYAELIHGTEGDDVLNGTAQGDAIYGHEGSDALRGRGGEDLLYGGAGTDILNGQKGYDQLYGGPGRDYLYPRANDFVSAGDGNDIVNAAYPGNAMVIRCGPGYDRVTFNEPHPGVELTGCEHVEIVSAG
jgi:Ca2+-binding RTX toxin-like protein